MDLDTYEWDPNNPRSFQELYARELSSYENVREPSEKLRKFIEDHAEECMHPESMLDTVLREQIKKKIANAEQAVGK